MATTKTVLCPVDLSPGSQRVVTQAGELAGWMGAQVELLYVYRTPLLPLEEEDSEPNEDVVVRMLKKDSHDLNQLSGPLQELGIAVKTALREGDASDTILREIDNSGASMVVLGTHGHSGFKHWLLGSTAERVVRLAHVPVVTVRVAS
jgi:nucleotide-binding universal stress UspA family protein